MQLLISHFKVYPLDLEWEVRGRGPRALQALDQNQLLLVSTLSTTASCTSVEAPHWSFGDGDVFFTVCG